MINKRGLSVFGRLGTIIIIIAVIVLVSLFFFRGNILGYLKSLPYQYDPEDIVLDVDETQFDPSSEEDVEVRIDFDLKNGVKGLLFGDPKGLSEYGWHVLTENDIYLPANAVGANDFRITGEDDFTRFDFGPGLVKLVSDLDQASDYEMVRAYVLVYEDDFLLRSVEVYRSEDAEGEVDSKEEKEKMINAIAEAYVSARNGVLVDIEEKPEEEIGVEDVVDANQIELIFDSGINDVVLVRWAFEDHRPGIIIRPNGKKIFFDGREREINFPSDDFFNLEQVREDIYERDVLLMKDILRAVTPAELPVRIKDILETERASIENEGNYDLSIVDINILLYGVEDIQEIMDQYG